MVKEKSDQNNNEEKIYYHYCRLDALFEIVKSKSVWLTSLESTNDKKELKYGQALLKTALQEMISDNNLIDKKIELEKTFSAPKDSSFIKYRPNYKYYGMSFVNNKDSLTHWERYGNNGFGICIAFNYRVIEDYFKTFPLSVFCTNWINFRTILYNKDTQLKYIKQILLNYINFIIKNLDETAKIYDTPNFCNLIYYQVLSHIKPILKDCGFEDEKEYRLIFGEGEAEKDTKIYTRFSRLYKKSNNTRASYSFIVISNNINEIINKLNLSQKNKMHNIIGNSIRSYYSMNLSEFWSDVLIPEIIIGPRCYQNINELKSFLKANNLSGTKVRVSEIPIR